MADHQLREAIVRNLDHAAASRRVNRQGWTDRQWIADARRLMGDVDGSVRSLVNGHALALLRRVDELEAGIREHRDATRDTHSKATHVAELRARSRLDNDLWALLGNDGG